MINSNELTLIYFNGVTEQGFSKPFKFIASDQNMYYVKQQKECRVKEWLAANLAMKWGLPIAPFSLVRLEEDLLDEIDSKHKGPCGLKPGVFFGSKHVDNCRWVEHNDLEKIISDNDFRQNLLIFDCWIQNQDRTSGNTNLIFNEKEQKTFVIDHNQAFDDCFCMDSFFNNHVFGCEWEKIKQDFFILPQLQEKMRSAFSIFDEAVNKIPDDWHWFNDEHDIPLLLNLEKIKKSLEEKCNAEFWRRYYG